ncbi:MAG TPA: ABC transporter substrate-binding protein [Caulobacteraceae bacterium]|nr:ABC transporter substrate-binding protein [Caulobacteraceae bacterium]
MRAWIGALAAGGALLGGTAAHAAAGRVVSLDSCADQYVVALADPAQIAGVTARADDADSWMRARARSVRVVRPSLESLLAVRPDVVVRYWGGDPRLMRALERRGVRVVQLDDAVDFEGVRTNVRRVAQGVGREGAGEALLREMDADLDASAGAWKGRSALYVTSGGYTAGKGTLIDAMLTAAGLANAAPGGSFAPISLERLVLAPPALFVKGFYDSRRADRRGPGRSRVLERLSRGRTAASLPGAMLSCPGWFAAKGSRALAERAPR